MKKFTLTKKAGDRLSSLLSYTVLILMSIIIIYPLLWTVFSSFNGSSTLFSSTLIPENFTLEHYKWLFDTSSSDYLIWYKNTLILAIGTMFFQTAIVTITGYAFSRFRFVGRKYGLLTFLVIQMVPTISALIAYFTLSLTLGMLDNVGFLMLIYIGGGIPMNTYLMKGYMDTIPRSLDEAMRIDGAGHLRIFWQIILPLAKPMVAVVAIWAFTGVFGDYILAELILRSSEKQTLAVGLHGLISEKYGNEFTKFAAGSILIAVPIGALFLSMQKFLIGGLASGSVKG